MQNSQKGCVFLEILHTYGFLPSFVILGRLLCLKDPINYIYRTASINCTL